ncbi:sensor domain-containing diguanylate cyclase [Rhodoferax fermentans]|uniref:Sensor domain-containing diguanylate cyclase n=1 Tax=Rhodoferax fermentans TaxID=28066 RepID=A0A1T1AUE8_RHOFE|nr:diguanylate cyclase [Rhodoferax fermentans]MBK1685358.1 sensor domain-containing diguanylate cyclase [Rhodoferax fermentans]OOV07605.1 sensor domain-containing diguanylate cyclase [Rhodoferax fermentans]
MNLYSSLTLRQWLTVPFTVLMVGVVVLTGALSYSTGSQAVNTVSQHLLQEMVARVGQAVNRHVVGSAAVLEAAFPTGLEVPDTIDAELDTLRTRFWIATSLHTDPNNFVYYGNQHGQAIGLLRLSSDEAELRYKLRADEFRGFSRFSGINGALGPKTFEKKLFDPRERPWYKAAERSLSSAWSAIYIDFTTEELVATRARRVLDAQGELQGVVATDISLQRLNLFVSNLPISSHGVAFIIEPDGKLIASSSGPNIKRLPGGGSERLMAIDSVNPLQRAAYQQVRDRLQSASLGVGPRALAFDGPNGETVEMAFDRVLDQAGLYWLIVVAVPRSDFMQGITANIFRTALIGLLGVIAAVVLGWRIVGWVDRDIKRLTEAAKLVGEGRLGAPLEVYRNDEIGVLASTFRKMQYRLRTDVLTGLSNREMLLHSITQRIEHKRRERDALSFALLFVDLNNFKLINDHLGHDAGDRVLMEIATRLSKVVRPGDVVARYAGDEFVLLINDIPSRQVADQVRRKLEATLLEPVQQVDLGSVPDGAGFGGAVGLAMYPMDGDTAELLIARADQEMYERKRAWRLDA